MTDIPEDVKRMAQELKAAYDKVKEWPENRMNKDAVMDLGEGFTDLLALRNMLPRAIAAIMADRAQRVDVDAAIERCAQYHDDLEARHAAAHAHLESDHHARMERDHRHHAAAIRALKGRSGTHQAKAALADARIAELEAEVAQLRERPADSITYSSTQETECASCGERKHTPLRRDEMGGYVCLTCIDKQLDIQGAKRAKDDESLWNFWNDKAREQAKTITELRERLAFLNAHTNLELTWGEIDGWDDDCQWCIHSRNGGRNDREWTLRGYGPTVEQAIDAARAADAEGK